MEATPGLVGVMECGVVKLQLVKVSQHAMDAHALNYIVAPPQWFVLYSLWRMETLRMTMKVDVLIVALLSAVKWDTVLWESQ